MGTSVSPWCLAAAHLSIFVAVSVAVAVAIQGRAVQVDSINTSVESAPGFSA